MFETSHVLLVGLSKSVTEDEIFFILVYSRSRCKSSLECGLLNVNHIVCMNNKDGIFLKNTLILTQTGLLSGDLNQNAILRKEINANASVTKVWDHKIAKAKPSLILISTFLKYCSKAECRATAYSQTLLQRDCSEMFKGSFKFFCHREEAVKLLGQIRWGKEHFNGL